MMQMMEMITNKLHGLSFTELYSGLFILVLWTTWEFLFRSNPSKEKEELEAYISGYGCSVPAPMSCEEFLRQNRAIRTQLGQSEEIIKFCDTMHQSSGIEYRYFSTTFLEDYTAKDVAKDPELEVMGAFGDIGFTKEKIYNKANNYQPQFWQRMKLFESTAVRLSVEAARKAIQQWGGNPKDITHLLTTCTSGWREPGIACAIMKELGLSDDCQKAELNFNGCFCGATLLRIGRDFIRAGDATAVLTVSCEAASIMVDFTCTDRDSLVAQSLFSDGAAAIVLTRAKGPWKFTQTGMSLLPDSSHLLGLRPPCGPDEPSYKMTLHKDVGATLGAFFRSLRGKELLGKMSDLSRPANQRPALCVHPGGPRILEAVSGALQEVGWQGSALNSSFKSFNSVGNLGSAAMMFVLTRRLALNDIAQDNLLMMAFGPGVTVEWATLQRCAV